MTSFTRQKCFPRACFLQHWCFKDKLFDNLSPNDPFFDNISLKLSNSIERFGQLCIHLYYAWKIGQNSSYYHRLTPPFRSFHWMALFWRNISPKDSSFELLSNRASPSLPKLSALLIPRSHPTPDKVQNATFRHEVQLLETFKSLYEKVDTGTTYVKWPGLLDLLYGRSAKSEVKMKVLWCSSRPITDETSMYTGEDTEIF